MKELQQYKICKNCGNRNHPRSGQCAWCGARMHRRRDWFALLGVLIIVLVLIGLVVYSVSNQPPSPARLRLPGLSDAAE